MIFIRLPKARTVMCVRCEGPGVRVETLLQAASRIEGIPASFLILTCGGRRVADVSVADGQWLTCVLTGLAGGKGGFGSMLRAIGAQIEKTTNREACRDLSGRRLRDINHEARLKRWVAKQAERESQRKQRKELREPQHKLEDPEYERIREQLPERVQDAVAQGLAAGTKRPASTSGECSAKKRPASALWLPDVPSDVSSDEDPDLSSGEGESSRAESSSEQEGANARTASEPAESSAASGEPESGQESNSKCAETDQAPKGADGTLVAQDPTTSEASSSQGQEPQSTDKDK
uniref:SDE2-like domain-containing protein n=1 Tax=Amblyomma maculatum TaxID=34609 RepID=G3MLS7_AMBMU